MVIFEDWIENPFSKGNHDLESAINLANLYWQGLDLKYYTETSRCNNPIFRPKNPFSTVTIRESFPPHHKSWPKMKSGILG